MRFYSVILMYSYQRPEICKLKFKVWALNFLSVYTFLWCFLFPLIEKRLKGKNEEAKVLLYSEKEHEKYTKTEMHDWCPIIALFVRFLRPFGNCIFHIKDAPSFRIEPGDKSVQGHKGTEDLTRAEGWVRCYVKKWFWRISSYLLNN